MACVAVAAIAGYSCVSEAICRKFSAVLNTSMDRSPSDMPPTASVSPHDRPPAQAKMTYGASQSIESPRQTQWDLRRVIDLLHVPVVDKGGHEGCQQGRI
jgi:hypothetical protein